MAQRWPRKLTLETRIERTTHANKGDVHVGILYGPRLMKRSATISLKPILSHSFHIPKVGVRFIGSDGFGSEEQENPNARDGMSTWSTTHLRGKYAP